MIAGDRTGDRASLEAFRKLGLDRSHGAADHAVGLHQSGPHLDLRSLQLGGHQVERPDPGDVREPDARRRRPAAAGGQGGDGGYEEEVSNCRHRNLFTLQRVALANQTDV